MPESYRSILRNNLTFVEGYDSPTVLILLSVS